MVPLVAPVIEDEVKPEISSQPKKLLPLLKPGCVNTTRFPTTSQVGGTQSPAVDRDAGKLPAVTPLIERNVLVAML